MEVEVEARKVIRNRVDVRVDVGGGKLRRQSIEVEIEARKVVRR